MKKSLLALAVLGAFAGAAAAQSSITIFGIVDANVGKDAGSDDKRVGQGAQSRLGFRGVEDLGNGLRATFHFQTRFDSGNGVTLGTPASSTDPFWQAEANVGLAGNFGNVRIGRQYTEAFYQQILADPFGYDTVAQTKTIIEGGIGSTRANNSVSYWITNQGITFGIQVAEPTDNAGATAGNLADPGTTGIDRPINARLSYAAGPLFVGISYEDPTFEEDDWTFVNGSYDFGIAKVGAFVGKGTTRTALDRQSIGITGVKSFGAGQGRLVFAELKGQLGVGGEDFSLRRQIAAGYHYSLSKRTVIYGDVVRVTVDEAAPAIGANGKDSDTGYDFGIKHSF